MAGIRVGMADGLMRTIHPRGTSPADDDAAAMLSTPWAIGDDGSFTVPSTDDAQIVSSVDPLTFLEQQVRTCD